MTLTTAALTTVELTWIEGRVERWIRFGAAVEEAILDRRRRILGFAPGVLFAFIRWSANDYGTVESRLEILRAVVPGESYQTVPLVCPGGELLLRANGWPKVERALQAIDAVEALGLDPAAINPDYWRHVHNRLSAGLRARAYGHAQHRAWLQRRRLFP